MSNEIKQIPLSQLNSFENHPFIEYTGERLDKMVRSIEESGIHSPLIVREKGGSYEILSGHNRANAARLLGWETAPCIVKESCSDDEAKLIVTETNFHQRAFADYKPSEKAKSIKMYNDAVRALKPQDAQNDVFLDADNSDNKANETVVGHDVPRVHTRDKSALQFGLSGRNISRYERLTMLLPEWLDKVDEGELGIVPANEITYLTAETQKKLLEYVTEKKVVINLRVANDLRKQANKKSGEKKGNLTESEIERAFAGKSQKASRVANVKLNAKTLHEYFPSGTKDKVVRDTIEKALAKYFELMSNGDVDDISESLGSDGEDS